MVKSVTVRTYRLPSTHDERLKLRAGIERDAAVVLEAFGFTFRYAHVQGCEQIPGENRRVGIKHKTYLCLDFSTSDAEVSY